jgi:PKD repeat protein
VQFAGEEKVQHYAFDHRVPNLPSNSKLSAPVTIADSDGGATDFSLQTNKGTAKVIHSYKLLPSQTFNIPIQVIFKWKDADGGGVIDGTRGKERNLVIVKDGVQITGRCQIEPGCSKVENKFEFPVSSWSDFALAYVSEPVVGEITVSSSGPKPIGSTVTFTASYSDIDDDDTHTAMWDWSDGTTSTGTVQQISNTVSNSHTFTQPGVYEVILVVFDDSFPEDIELAGLNVFEYAVVYDPAGGFVTGGGWINSPPGAYALNPSLTGKANFGFVAKYKKGATIPTGETQFRFQAGDLDFHSTSYDWLVVANAKAMYKGVGKINQGGNYGFLISAIDSDLTSSPNDRDTFRIKIWDKNNGNTVVYDNQMNADENSDPTTILGGGKIQIHKS